MPDLAAQPLAQLRQQGTKLAVEHWHEAGIVATCPDTAAGARGCLNSP